MRIFAIAFFCCALALITASGSVAQPAGEIGRPAVVTGIKAHYKSGDSVSARIKSTIDADQLFSCSVEFLDHGKWREVALSVFADDPPKSARLVSLPAMRSSSWKWNPWAGAPDSPFPNGQYRFRIDMYKIAGGKVTDSLRSKQFTIEATPPT